MRVAILGRTRMLYESIEMLLSCGHEIVLIGTCKAAPEYDVNEDDFRIVAEKLKVPFFCDSRINSEPIVKLLRECRADVAVSMNWLTIIRDDAISCFKYGILNAHCGDLPRYRGNACPNWAILNGEEQFAISIHYMDAGSLDSGNIVLKERFPLNDTSTITDVYTVIENNIPRMFAESVNLLSQGFVGTPQSKLAEDALRCYPRIPSDSMIDWNCGKEQISRLVRASCAPFAGAYTYYEDKKIYILDCKISSWEVPSIAIPGQVIFSDKGNGTVGIACADGVILVDTIRHNGVEENASDVITSARGRMNYVVDDEIYELRRRMKKLEESLAHLTR